MECQRKSTIMELRRSPTFYATARARDFPNVKEHTGRERRVETHTNPRRRKKPMSVRLLGKASENSNSRDETEVEIELCPEKTNCEKLDEQEQEGME